MSYFARSIKPNLRQVTVEGAIARSTVNYVSKDTAQLVTLSEL